MSITFVYRDENNKVQVKKIDYEEVKKDLIKYLSHDIRSIIKEKEEKDCVSFTPHLLMKPYCFCSSKY